MAGAPPIPQALWDRIPADAQAALLVVVQQYEQRIATLEQHVADLRDRLQQNSRNSSLPPSRDGLDVKRAPPRPRSGRPRGGQEGHALQRRPPLPPTRPPVVCKPERCRRCGHRLAGDDPRPLRHQVIELPPLQPEVTDYHLHRLCCPHCRLTTCASLPAGVPRGQYGPRLQAALGVLSGGYRLSKRMIEALCADLLNVPICAGQVCALEAATAEATEPVVAPLRAYVQTQNAHADETSWQHDQRRAWLWVVVTSLVSVFTIARSRSGRVAKGLLGPGYAHVASTDRYNAYHWLPRRQRQVCWAHLQRDFQAMVDRGGPGAAIGEELLCCAQDLFTWWQRIRDGTMRRSTFYQYVQSYLRPQVRETLEAGRVCGCAKTAGVCGEILKLEPCLWTFCRVAGVEPTNNAAERGLRHAVQWRKTSYGTQGESGRRFVSNILTIVATCRQQGRNVLEFVTQCCEAQLNRTTPPSLLPQTA